MIDVRLRDGFGSRHHAFVDGRGSVQNVVFPAPPDPSMPGLDHVRIFRQYLTADGTSSGSTDARVDGSSTAVDFWVPADTQCDRYLRTLSFVIADASQTLSEFGNLNAALTNGCRIFYEDSRGEVVVHDALKTNFDFIRLCLGTPAVGDGATAFRASNVSGSSEGYIPFLDLASTFGMPWGIRLGAGSKEKLTLRVRDDLTGVDQFDVIAYGIERIPD